MSNFSVLRESFAKTPGSLLNICFLFNIINPIVFAKSFMYNEYQLGTNGDDLLYVFIKHTKS